MYLSQGRGWQVTRSGQGGWWHGHSPPYRELQERRTDLGPGQFNMFKKDEAWGKSQEWKPIIVRTTGKWKRPGLSLKDDTPLTVSARKGEQTAGTRTLREGVGHVSQETSAGGNGVGRVTSNTGSHNGKHHPTTATKPKSEQVSYSSRRLLNTEMWSFRNISKKEHRGLK